MSAFHHIDGMVSDAAANAANSRAAAAERNARENAEANAANLAMYHALLAEVAHLFAAHPLATDKILIEKIKDASILVMRSSKTYDDARRVGREYQYEGGFDSPQGIRALQVYLRRKGIEFSDEVNFDLDEIIMEEEAAERRRIAAERAEAEAKATAEWNAKIDEAEQYLAKGFFGKLLTTEPDTALIEAAQKRAQERQAAGNPKMLLRRPVVPAPGMRPEMGSAEQREDITNAVHTTAAPQQKN